MLFFVLQYLLQAWGILLQLILLNEAAVVLVDDGEGLLQVIVALGGQTAFLEETLVVEGVGSWNTDTRALTPLAPFVLPTEMKHLKLDKFETLKISPEQLSRAAFTSPSFRIPAKAIFLILKRRLEISEHHQQSTAAAGGEFRER